MSKIAAKMTDLDSDTPFTNDIERAQTLYFNWLCEMVHVDNYCGKTWYVLAKILHNIEFYWILPNDENRAIHGVKLRQVWMENIEEQAEDLGVGHPMFPLDSLTGPCSVFEMLVGLAVSIESEIMMNPDKGNRTAVWFWEMLKNLVHIECLYDDYISEENGEDLKTCVIRFMDRDYRHDGIGGLFPQKYPRTNIEDQRYVEIWYQAQHWLEENYAEEFY